LVLRSSRERRGDERRKPPAVQAFAKRGAAFPDTKQIASPLFNWAPRLALAGLEEDGPGGFAARGRRNLVAMLNGSSWYQRPCRLPPERCNDAASARTLPSQRGPLTPPARWWLDKIPRRGNRWRAGTFCSHSSSRPLLGAGWPTRCQYSQGLAPFSYGASPRRVVGPSARDDPPRRRPRALGPC
jgi:hypothetical protein